VKNFAAFVEPPSTSVLPSSLTDPQYHNFQRLHPRYQSLISGGKRERGLFLRCTCIIAWNVKIAIDPHCACASSMLWCPSISVHGLPELADVKKNGLEISSSQSSSRISAMKEGLIGM